ncbi:BatA domain-containing protein [Stenotrophomonas sp. PFBMAA-4]|uniref:BatA domain-containing protein n=1 Tax=Stenotrophomonas sp. PFBMAA-4 TaxID=3043301 RepID=UPI0024B61442|nr:BatA domain-containing protein [Stenotrophomonas sp. PFBMAA-4]MDI9274588.1 BatA domain-containing protein [Stenotrophomonas sp. PFBMAA-4]
MTLLFPLGLAALAAWLLPLLIHLARRHPYTPLDFAALRWLRAQIRPRQRIRFDDWPLLLVRLLLLAALALLLARPALTGSAPPPGAWTVVAPGLDARALRGSSEVGHWHWLAPGFPSVDQPAPGVSVPLASLLRELDAQLPTGTALTVHVPDPLPGLDGARLQLSRPVHWQPHPAASASTQATVAPPRLRVHAEAPASARQWISTLQRAWSTQPAPAALPADTLPARGEIAVWSGTGALPSAWQAWLRDGGSVLTAAAPAQGASVRLRTAEGAPLLWQQRVGQGRLLSLPGEWDATHNAALRDARLPQSLLMALQPPPPARVADAQDQAPQQAVLPASAAAPSEPTPWLLMAIVLLFALERGMASRSARRPA